MYSDLRSRILDGRLAPGERLVELDLARTPEVSQAPVRDALIRLAHDGPAVKAPRRGSYVATVDRDEARSVYELRAVLEEFAARHACELSPAPDLQGMRQHLEGMHVAASANDLESLVEHDMAFHRELYSLTRHPLLPRIWPMLENTMRAFTAVSNRVLFRSLEVIAATHDPLLAALEEQDGATAATLFREHVQYVWTEMEGPRGP